MDPSLTGLGDVLTGCLLGAVGLGATALSLYRRRGADPLLVSLGIFCLLYGTRLVVSNPLTPALGFSGLTAAWIRDLSTYLILVPAWFFFWKLLGNGWHSLLLWSLRMVTAFAILGIASDLIQSTPGTLTGYPNNVVVIVGLIGAALGFRSHRGHMTTDLRILMGGLSIFAVFAINDNLVSMGLLPWSWHKESIGFVIFVGCLGWIAARRFVSTERNLASVEGEMEAAKRIQASILPARAPEIEGLSIAYRFEPSSAVAGDLFEFLTLDERRVGLLVADVSGHGVPAALIASMVKVAVTSRVDCADRPAELLTRVNQTLCGSFQHGFVSAVYTYIDLENGELIAASAGHPYPLLQRRSETDQREVGGSGPILGRFPTAEFRQERLPLEPGDRLVLYSDGIVEAPNANDEIFGEERLRRLLIEDRTPSTEEFCDSLMQALHLWTGNRSHPLREDDLTLLVLDYQGTPPRPHGPDSR